MPQQYLLPCECGQATAVGVAQAGRTLACSCGRDLRVPSLAGLRQLNPADQLFDKPRQQPWNPARGGLFVVGVVLAVVGLALGALGSYNLRRIDVGGLAEQFRNLEIDDLDYIEKMPPADTYELWKRINGSGLGYAGSAEPVQAKEAADFWMTVSIVGFAIAGTGILIAGASVVSFGAGSTKKFPRTTSG